MTGADRDDLTLGVLSLHNSKESKAILNAAEALGFGTAWLREETVAIGIEDGAATLEPDVDVVANRLLLSKEEQLSEALGLAATVERLVPTLNPSQATMIASHKFATAVALANEGIPVPDALLALSTDRLEAGRDRFGPEAVYKTAVGTHGGGTWKVGSEDAVSPTVGGRRAFLQKYVEHDAERHSDLRVYVVGDRIVGAMNRYAPEGDWRTNVALGGDVADAGDLPDGVREMAIRAREVIGLDYAGVDVIEGADGWYVLEVNPTAGFKGLFRATGLSPAPYIVAQAAERVGASVDAGRVDELAATLDDSRPTARPRSRESRQREQVPIGYIEEVVAAGTRGNRRVLAKSDTGATRTSIDTGLAAEIGTGPIRDIVRVKSGSLKKGKARPVVDVVVGIGGTQHTVPASIEDRSHMDYPLLLGRDILKHYSVDVRKRADETTESDERSEE